MDPEANYTVSYDPDQGSMQFLYDLTDIFLRPIIKDDILPQSFFDQDISIGDFLDQFLEFGPIVQDVLDQNRKFVAILAFGILFAVIR